MITSIDDVDDNECACSTSSPNANKRYLLGDILGVKLICEYLLADGM